MRIAVEALGAEFGGIRVYLENLLAAWTATHPDDDLLVIAKKGSALEVGGHQRHDLEIASPDALFRPLAQTRRLPKVIEEFGADVSMATIPVTGLLRTRYPQVVVVHDLRHELRPQEFSRTKRWVRGVAYTRAYAVADGFISVSARSLGDLHRLHPSTARKPAAVVHHGADHVHSWGVPDGGGSAIAFGHHTNKRPDLVISAWAGALRAGLDLPPLQVLGVTEELRTELEALVRREGVADRVTLCGYVSDDELRAAMLGARLLVLPSTFEGFGIPIVEAMALGVPVVIGPDPGAVETAGGHASVMAEWSVSALVEALGAATRLDSSDREAARRHADEFTWANAVRGTRAFLSARSRSRDGSDPAASR